MEGTGIIVRECKPSPRIKIYSHQSPFTVAEDKIAGKALFRMLGVAFPFTSGKCYTKGCFVKTNEFGIFLVVLVFLKYFLEKDDFIFELTETVFIVENVSRLCSLK